MTQGDLIRLRAYGGIEIVRRVAGFTDKGQPLFCTEEEYESAVAEVRAPKPVGWPKEHILGPAPATSVPEEE